MRRYFTLGFCLLSILLPLRIHSLHHGGGCTVGNKTCSDYCLTDGAGNGRCACPCGEKLGNDNQTCVYTSRCNVDIYVGIDTSSHLYEEDCRSNTSTYTGLTAWQQSVRDCVLVPLASIDNTVAGSPIYVGVQHYAQKLTTQVTYPSPLNTPGIGSVVRNCSHGSDFLVLAQSVGDLPPSEYQGPGPLRSRVNTTRVAIGIVYKYSMTATDEEILSARAVVLKSFDYIFIITTSHSNATVDQRNTERARLQACGNATAKCKRVFWLDRLNDYGVPFNLVTLSDQYNSQLCLVRPPTTTPLIQESCDGAMNFSLLACTLRGIKLRELQFKDPSCSLEHGMLNPGTGRHMYSQRFGQCGMTQKYIIHAGYVFLEHEQTITTRNMSSLQKLPSVNFKIICKTIAFKLPLTFHLKPSGVDKDAYVSKYGNFGLTMEAYTSHYFNKHATQLTYGLNCPVYVQAYLHFDLKLVPYKCYASDKMTDPSIHYYFIKNGCHYPGATTFKSLPAPSNKYFRYQFSMFEFANTYKKTVKLPIYIICKFYICPYYDTSPECNPRCARRRRDVPSTSQSQLKTVEKTLGPFYPMEEKETEENKKPSNEPEVKEEEKASSKHLVGDDMKEPNIVQSERDSFSLRVIKVALPVSYQKPTTLFLYLSLLIVAVLTIAHLAGKLMKPSRKTGTGCNCSSHPPSYQDLPESIKFLSSSETKVPVGEKEAPPHYEG